MVFLGFRTDHTLFDRFFRRRAACIVASRVRIEQERSQSRMKSSDEAANVLADLSCVGPNGNQQRPLRAPLASTLLAVSNKIGRASCRERVSIAVRAES